jgi:hypothetical protein
MIDPHLLILMVPIVVEYAVWRVFRLDKRFKPKASNNWRNEEFVVREVVGNACEGTRQVSDSTAPLGYPGE